MEDVPNSYVTATGVVLIPESSTGPTDDGRIKPDIVANGAGVYSTYNINNNCAISNLTYGTYNGTSQAAASVTGSCALLQDHYTRTHGGNFMLASTLKALLIETADESGLNPGPDYQFGWGLMNTQKAAELISVDKNQTNRIQELSISNGQTIDFAVNLATSNNCYLSATIAWNDPAGTPPALDVDPSALMLVNDLDMRIIDPSNGIHYPWALAPTIPGLPAAQYADNFRDNVEQVRIFNAPPGNYIVRLTHKGTLAAPQDFSLITNSTPDIDLYVKDQPEDVGVEPNPINGPMWVSEDIWVRNQNDGLTNQFHQNPEYHSTSTINDYVYVRVRNKGCTASLGTEKLKLYWSKAGTAMSWQAYWTGNLYSGCSSCTPPFPTTNPEVGNFISEETIPIIPSGGETIVRFDWHVPNPDDYCTCNPEPWHFCLLSRIDATNDPMTFTEGTFMYDNAKNNNNIAWKNITIVDLVSSSASNGECFSDRVVGGTIAVGNPYETGSDVYDLEFTLDPQNKGVPLNEQAEIKITLDEMSWNKWANGGFIATNISVKREECRQLIVTGNPAYLKNLTYDNNQRSTMHVSFNFLTDKVDNTMEFDYHVIQRIAGEAGKIVGGELYKIRKPVRYLFTADAGDNKKISKNETVILSASNIGESAYYNWYNIAGELIYSGPSLTISPDITTKYKLEVIALSDGFASYDSMTVEIKDCEIISMSPNPTISQVTVEYKTITASSAYLVITQVGSTVNNNYILNQAQMSTTINVSEYTPGNYNIVLICDGVIKDQKILSIQ